tara:strand:- start:67 stop:1044 length:978 start_codon:yes stop_codon:yes gene_type:complete
MKDNYIKQSPIPTLSTLGGGANSFSYGGEPPSITTDGLYYYMDANNSNVMSGSSRTLQSYDRIGYVPKADLDNPPGYNPYFNTGSSSQWQQGQHNNNADSSIYYTAPSGGNTGYFTFDGRPSGGGYGLGVQGDEFNAYGKSWSWDGWVRPYDLGNFRSTPYGYYANQPIVMSVNKQPYGAGNGSFSATQHWFYVWRYNSTNAWWGIGNHDSSGGTHTMTGVMPTSFNWATNNDWYHFAITLNGSTGKRSVYIDGSLNMSSTNSNYASVAYTNYQHHARLYIGGAAGNGTDVFRGDVSITRFYNNKELTAAEVLANYNLQKGLHGK